jgi:type IV secretory pathway TraG/TraD family ATPase VirD4
MTRIRLAFAAALFGAGYVVWTRTPTWLPIIGAVVIVGMAVAWHRFSRTSARVVRTGERSRRKHGVASTWDVLRYGSAWSVRRKGRVVRPSTAALSRTNRLRLPTSQVAVKLCRVGAFTVWMSTEDAAVVVGGPRTGKTGLLAARIIDAPGAVISTSTRRDLLAITSQLRATGGRPIYVYNPAGLGGITSTLAFNPLHGCTDPRRAAETATDMIPTSSGDGERWDAQARRVLGVLLHAAALAELPISVVAEWIADPDASAQEVLSALRRTPDLAHVEIAKQFFDTNTRTRSSVTSSIMPALAWLTSPEAVAALHSGTQLDVAHLLATRATVYVLGRHEAHTAGLLAALTGRIVREARTIASYQPGGRLDPPLTLALDEAARIAPIDLPDLSGDCGGTGITLLAVFQSRADITDRWGPSGAARLITNCAARVLFGGTADPAELKAWSELAGERDEKVESYNAGGKRTGHSTRKVPVLPATQIASPGEFRAIVFHRNMPPVIGRVRMAWHRNDVRNSLSWRLIGSPITRWRAAAAPTSAHHPGGLAPTPPTTRRYRAPDRVATADRQADDHYA